MNRPDGSITIDETAPGSFSLAVTVDGRRFECGSYLSRAEAQKAGKLFLERKAAERVGQKSRPRRRG